MTDNFCILPWVSVEANSLGQVRPCCIYEGRIKYNGTDHPMFCQYSTLEEAFHSDTMQDLRKRFLNGEQPEECVQCWTEEAAGRSSKRQGSKIVLQDIISEDDIDFTNLTPDTLLFLDLKLGNICNLTCRVCAGWSSRKLIKEELSHLSSKEQVTHEVNRAYNLGQWARRADRFWDNLKTILPNVRYIEFTGGEPFLIKQQFEILEYAVEHDLAKNIRLHYNTNATIFPEKAHLWKHFNDVQVAFSIDNIKDRFEFERKGTNWKETKTVLAQFFDLASDFPHIRTQICLTVNVQNVYYLPEICAWINSQQFHSTFFNILHYPPELNIGAMTTEAKAIVKDKLTNADFTSQHSKQIGYILNFMENGTSTDGTAFCKRMKNQDTYRNENFTLLYPEIAEAMGYE